MKNTEKDKQGLTSYIATFITSFIIFFLLISALAIAYSLGTSLWQAVAAFYGRTPKEFSDIVLGSAFALSIAVVAYKALK